MKTVSQNTPTIYSATTPENNPPQLVASLVPDEQRISFWPQHFGLIPQWVWLPASSLMNSASASGTQHFGLIPQWVTTEPRVFGWMDRLCEDYCGGIWNLYTLNNGGAFMAPEPDDDDDETWVLFNAMNGNRAEMSPEAAGIAACLMTYSHHACRTENYAMTVHYYRLRDYALQHPECSAIMRIID
ncbi:antirestriction protein [Escherichia coli]|nr:antirestriction protein [Escherichia coli]